ncbi:hypothetical protein LCGC14_0589060 [marine sediment metagenome]|uniref:Uncharacterized protein n=1 Tax=marine sediment metagenome TaxID=412755 RepID=A0A0F9RIZ4_9ZZZZ
MSAIFIGGVGGVISFGVLVIVFSLMADVLTTSQATQGVTSGATAVNETFSASGTLLNAGTPTIGNNINNDTEVVRNATTLFTDGTDYTLTQTGVFTIIAASTDTNITYDYTVFAETAEFNVTGSGLLGFTNIGNLVPTMGLIFGIVLVLSLLVGLLFLFGTRVRGSD